MTFKPPNCKNVYLKKGPITTSNVWNKPTVEPFHVWIQMIKKYIAEHEITIDMYVCGKFLENRELTWDIDIILSHRDIKKFTLPELTKVRDLMIYGMQLGFDKFNLLIDMACYIPFDDQGTFWYSSEDYLKYGRIRSQVLYVFDKIYQNGEIIQDFNTQSDTSIKRICEDMFLVSKVTPSEKHINRIKEGTMYKQPQRIL